MEKGYGQEKLRAYIFNAALDAPFCIHNEDRRVSGHIRRRFKRCLLFAVKK
jgi:hypothetical protein